jgi:hypothetical protein
MTDPESDKSLVIDEFGEKLAAFQALRKSDAAAADSLLNSLGAQDDVDRDIVLELGARRPLAYPHKFDEAHRLAVRALEVLDRNGARGVKIKGAGPFNSLAAFLVQQVATFIVRSHQGKVATEMRNLYARREANAERDSEERRMLTRARYHMEKLLPGFKRNALGVPLFVVGGAAFSTVLSVLQRASASALDELWGRIAASLLIGLIVVGVAWVILRGAAVARRRIHLTLDGPIFALWETIGRCGRPPRDPTRAFALIAIILALIPWLLIPILLAASWVVDKL